MERYAPQFIEGVNEGAKPAPDKFLQVQEYPSVAVQYSPTIAFALARIDICLVWSKYDRPTEYLVRLYSDYDDNPTDIVLSEGRLAFAVGQAGFGWRSIELDQHAVVFPPRKYWIGLQSMGASYALMRTDKGTGVAIRAQVNEVWSPGGGNPERVMLRLYGKPV